MRLYAKRRGFHLSDKGLYYQQRIPYFSNIPYRIGENIPCQSEEEIFSVLGLPYKTPAERNVFDNDHLFKESSSCEHVEESQNPQNGSYNFREEDSE